MEWTSVISVLVVIVAAVAAAAAWKSASAASKAAQAQLVVRFLEEYASSEMADALRTLKPYHERESDILGVKMKVRSLDPVTDAARRKVFHYFEKAYRLYEHGLLSKKSLCLVTGVSGVFLLYEVVEPLSRGTALPGTDEADFDWFERLRKACPPT